MGNSWNKRHEHESPEKIRRDKMRYDKWKADFKKRFPKDEDFRNYIRKKYRWPKYNKYQRGKYGDE